MGLIAAELLHTLQEHLQRHQVVVWFDPEAAYPGIVEDLAAGLQTSLSGLAWERYDPAGGFLALRRRLEPLWSGDEPPRLLLYVPLAESQAHSALAEYLAGGVWLGPGAHPPERNTRLALAARRALSPALPAAAVEKIVSEVEHRRLNLAEIEALAAEGLGAQLGALAIVFQSASLDEIALRFLADPALDAELQAKSAAPALAAQLSDLLEAGLGGGEDLPALRARLRRLALSTEFLASLGAAPPAGLRTLHTAGGQAGQAAAVRLARAWRQRRDLAESYRQAALSLEAELELGSQDWSIEQLAPSHTFLRTERLLQELVERRLVEKPLPDKKLKELQALIQNRLSGFWPGTQPAARQRWEVDACAARVLGGAAALQHALKAGLPAGALFQRYTGQAPTDPAAWCTLDTAQRQFEHDLQELDLDFDEHAALERLAAAARRSYAEAAHQLAVRFVHAYEAAGFHLPGVQLQADIYRDFVEPAAAAGPTAYILVDALRYEMARQFCAQLPGEWQASLVPALAAAPTITEVGMAALLPGAERGLAISAAGNGALAVAIQETPLKNRAERMRRLEQKGASPVAVVELHQLAPLTSKALRSSLKAARLVVVTAVDEIDGQWEQAPHLAIRQQEEVFILLRRALHTLAKLGVQRMVVTADHGFLAGEGLATGEPLEPPGGDTADLHRRAWVGRGGAALPACLRRPLSAFGVGGDLELVTPYGLSIFRSPGGSTRYFHGGLSLQELVVPVLSITSGASRLGLETPAFRWEAVPGSRQISTRFFSVTIKGASTDLFSAAAPPRLQVELRAGDQVISTPVAATYGYNETTHQVAMAFEPEQQVTLEANTVTLLIAEIPQAETVTLHVLDETGRGVCPELTIPINVAI
jgi:hypothetical protein